MARRAIIGLTVLIVGFVGGSLVSAQQGFIAVIRQPVQLEAVKPLVVSGADVGFRIEARRGRTPVGKLVIRTDGGAWEDAEFSTPDMALTSR